LSGFVDLKKKRRFSKGISCFQFNSQLSEIFLLYFELVQEVDLLPNRRGRNQINFVPVNNIEMSRESTKKKQSIAKH
jgi:hypothetical protein